MHNPESDLAEALARLLPGLDYEAQIRIQFVGEFRAGILALVGGRVVARLEWSEVAALLAQRIRESNPAYNRCGKSAPVNIPEST